MSEPVPPTGPSQVVKFVDDQAALAARVFRIESILVGFVAAVGMVCLALGELLPFLDFSMGGQRVDEPVQVTTASLASFGFRGVAFRREDGSADGGTVFIGVAFIGLLIVVLASMAALLVIAQRAGSAGSARWMGIVAVLLVIGVIGMWVTIGVGSGSRGFALHQGPFWLTAGTVVFAFLIWTSTARSLWIRQG